jgi:hypothetical protein
MTTRLPTALLAIIIAAGAHAFVGAQSVGDNKNIVAGVANQVIGDMYRQRQNETVACVFSNNPEIQMYAYNDYRTVDLALDEQVGTPSPIQRALFARLFDIVLGRRPKPDRPTPHRLAATAWIGLSFTDNGKDFYTGLHPGSPFSPELASDELKQYGFEAASDPVFAALPDKCLLAGIAFTAGGLSAGFVSSFTNLNNSEKSPNVKFDFSKKILLSDASHFVDKPSIAAGPNGKVYVAFVVFDESDPAKLSSKVVMFRSNDYGQTWPFPPVVLSEPLTRNQSPWIVVDPNNENNVYVGWRLFSRKTNGLTNAIVGKRSTNGGASFTPNIPYPVALSLKAYDQPMTEYPVFPPIPRSNSYPTAVMDSHGTIHLALQEYVNPSSGYVLAPWEPVSNGVARITISSSYNKGTTWTLRRAIDYGPGSGPQFMPTLAVTGRPGPTCPGKIGPRSLISLMYFDARASYPNGAVFLGGGDARFDVRVAQADPCTTDAGKRPVFGQSQQVSQYLMSSVNPTQIVKAEPTQLGYAAVNRPLRIFNAARSAFAGDYIHITPKVSYVRSGIAWKATTAATVNPAILPAPVFVGAWPDTRDIILPTVLPQGAPPPALAPGDPGYIDTLPWENYVPPGSGPVPPNCFNPGSRDQNPYAADVHGGLFAAAPVTFRESNIPRSYPLYVENRTPDGRFYRLNIDAAADAQFNVPEPGVSPDKESDVTINPFSTVTGVVIVNAGFNSPVVIRIRELVRDTAGNFQLKANGLQTTVTLHTAGADIPDSDSETHAPDVSNTPTESKPFGNFPLGGAQIGTRNPFGQNPFGQNPFGQNPFGQNPFGQNPFGQNPTVYDVTDYTFLVTNAGSHSSSYSAITNIQNALAVQGFYAFQVFINRKSLVPGLSGNCSTVETGRDNQISNIQTAFIQNPFGQNPFGQNPFGQNPFGQNPFGQNDPVGDPGVSNSTFYIAPETEEDSQQASLGVQPNVRPVRVSARAGLRLARQAPGGPIGFRGPRPPDEILYVLRVFQMRATAAIPPASRFDIRNVTLQVISHVPDVIDGEFQDEPPGDIAGPARLVFSTQPVTTGEDLILPAVQVTVQDGSGATATNWTTPITVALGANPGGATLTGTLTRTPVNGVATFDDLRISSPGVGFTLRATSAGLQIGTSNTFNIVRTLLVTNTSNTGAGSLRQAMTDANALANSGGNDVIAFDIVETEGGAPYFIDVQSTLPTITEAVTIDGTTQFDFDGTPVIALDWNGDGTASGLHITAGPSIVRGLVISGFPLNGILVEGANGTVIAGNYIGTDVAGVQDQGNGGSGIHLINSSGSTIGGPSAADRNVVSGNTGEGIRIDGAAGEGGPIGNGNLVQGNYVGTNAAGTADVGNQNSGIYLRRSGGNTVRGNLVSGQDGFAGVAICGNLSFCGGGSDSGTNNAAGNVVQGNLIGTNAAGSGPLGNSGYGVSIDGASNTLAGGTTAGAGNVIANNGLVGVVVFAPPARGNQIRGNSISSNASVGINLVEPLGEEGPVTANDTGDGDAGPNDLQNFPVLSSATSVSGSTSINGTLNSRPSSTFTIDFYSSAVCDSSGFGEGATPIGSTTVTTDSEGNVSFAITLGVGLAAGNQITATATDAQGNTSEFSGCRTVSGPIGD